MPHSPAPPAPPALTRQVEERCSTPLSELERLGIKAKTIELLTKNAYYTVESVREWALLGSAACARGRFARRRACAHSLSPAPTSLQVVYTPRRTLEAIKGLSEVEVTKLLEAGGKLVELGFTTVRGGAGRGASPPRASTDPRPPPPHRAGQGVRRDALLHAAPHDGVQRAGQDPGRRF